jgi:4,5:9,10-diseco-3-hydroxy-5,9,17-trioxoandrosta-1(10),2-diene-4-oate hydrolase
MTTYGISEGRYINAGKNLRLHYVECGTGVPVIFIHGSGPGASGKSNFAANMLSFAAAGFRAIAPDLFGYGFSSKPTDRNYNLAFQISGLKALVDGLGLSSVVLVGNSLGGAVAMHFTMEYPDLVSRLVLLAPGGLASKARYLRMPGIRSMLWAQLGPGGPNAAKLRKVFNRQLYDPSGISDALIEERLAVARTQPRQVYKTLKIDNLVPRLHEIGCPTLAFWGSHDQFCPIETAQHLVREIPDCRVIMISRCGHWAQVEHPDLFNRECQRFLKEGSMLQQPRLVEAVS